MQSINYYKAIHGSLQSNSAQDTLRREVRKDRLEDYSTSIGYVPDATVNGVIQPIVAKTTNAKNKYNVIAMPGDPLAVGDFLEFYGERWIVIDVASVDVVSLIGIAMQCNHLFRWQSWSPEIVERWGVLDSGVYSTTVKEEEKVIIPDKQYKIYLQLDDDTAKIHLDKRLATEKAYNKDGEQILVVYTVTGRDATSESYGKGSHLLRLDIRSDSYNRATDNLDEMICDYIAPDARPNNPVVPDDTESDDQEQEVVTPAKLSCVIAGRDTLRAGLSSRNYSATFFADDEVTVDTSVNAVWSVSVPDDMYDYVHYEVDGCKLSISADEELIGEMITLSVTDGAGLYNTAVFEVEVVSAI